VTAAGGELVEVTVTEEERVVARGTAQTRWYYRRGDGWEKVTEAPGAVALSQDKGPGTIWERAITLRLAVGTVLRRVLQRPAPPERLDPFSYLKKESRAPRYETLSREYRVDARGRVLPVSSK
jgi:hypothetical protein